jgi:excisionase family DNA binding protein
VKFYTVEEIAEMTQLTEGTVRRLIKGQQLEAVRFGNKLRVSEVALQSYLKNNSTFPKEKSA